MFIIPRELFLIAAPAIPVQIKAIMSNRRERTPKMPTVPAHEAIAEAPLPKTVDQKIV